MRSPEQDLAGGGGLLQTGRDVHRVAGHDLLVARAGHHVAGVHPDPAGERHPVVAVELRVQRLERRAHLARGADGAQRVVLVDLRHAEDGHDGVADVLLDGAAVVFDRRPHRVEVPLHDPTDRLGVERLTHRGGAGDVAEHDRDRLPDLVRGPLGGQRCGAVLTELRPVPVLVSARLASQHVGSLERRRAGRDDRVLTPLGPPPMHLTHFDIRWRHQLPAGDSLRTSSGGGIHWTTPWEGNVSDCERSRGSFLHGGSDPLRRGTLGRSQPSRETRRRAARSPSKSTPWTQSVIEPGTIIATTSLWCGSPSLSPCGRHLEGREGRAERVL